MARPTRGSAKLAWALAYFGVNVNGKLCCDLGAHVGGFTAALLAAGAARVYAVDTGRGILAWHLRNDPRVVALENTNALHVVLPEKVALATIDVGWTRQELILPKAASLLAPCGSILSLIKPQYEAAEEEKKGGRVCAERLAAILDRVRKMAESIMTVRGIAVTPFRGRKGGNPEYFMLLEVSG